MRLLAQLAVVGRTLRGAPASLALSLVLLPFACGAMSPAEPDGDATLVSEAGTQPPRPAIVIIIDDLGNHRKAGERLARFPAPLTLAFLPHRPHTEALATLGHQYGKEIMLHAPMENTRSLPLGTAGLYNRMTAFELTLTLRRSLRAIPHVTGVNNHMGSSLTQNQQAMNVLMRELSYYPVFFIDSKTTANTLAYDTARDFAIPTMQRDVFLDHNINTSAIARQFHRLVTIARKRGHAIGIGHPYAETILYLEKALLDPQYSDIEYTSIKSLWWRLNGAVMFDDIRRHPTTRRALPNTTTAATTEQLPMSSTVDLAQAQTPDTPRYIEYD